MTELPSIPAILPWPAGSSVYPAIFDGFTSQLEGQFAKDINDITAAIAAIESTLGANPAGGSPTVKLALSGLQSALSALAVQVSTLSSVPGPPNTFFRFTQSTPSADWDIIHPLGRFPAVTVVDSGGTVVEGDVAYLSDSHLTIAFSAAFAGEASLS